MDKCLTTFTFTRLAGLGSINDLYCTCVPLAVTTFTLFYSVLALQALVNELGSNGAFTGTLASDSSNVVDLVRQLYNVSGK